MLSQDRSVCLNAPLGRFIALATAKLFSVYWFFSRASCAVASEVILLPQRLALKYNTTPPASLSTLFDRFFHLFLCSHQNSSKPQGKLRRSCIAAAAAKVEESSPGTIQIFRIFAGSARRPVPAWAAFRSGQWAWGPIHCNNCLRGSSEPQTALPPH